jgi:hypothetical protein
MHAAAQATFEAAQPTNTGIGQLEVIRTLNGGAEAVCSRTEALLQQPQTQNS